MHHKKCLNCGKKLYDKYCAHGGQKSDTHRITFQNFIVHDVLHGTFHIERGILFTAKQALLRPGQAALDYISGKRKPYYNVFLLILLTIGLLLFTRHYYDELMIAQDRRFIPDTSDLNEASRKMNYIFSEKSKIIFFLFVPLAAWNSYILFRKKKLNLSEHAIIAGMILLGSLLLSFLFNAVFYLNLLIEFSPILSNIIDNLGIFVVISYIAYGYFNAFGSDYTRLGFTYRFLLFFILFLVQMIALLLLTFGFVSNWEFGEVEVNPF